MSSLLQRVLWVGMFASLAALLAACSGESSGGDYRYVEIAPGKYVPVRFPVKKAKNLVIKYNGQIVTFRAPSAVSRPESLMEYNGKLYVLAPGEWKPKRSDWRLRCFEQKGDAFVEIPVQMYPRSIAIVNIWRPEEEELLMRPMHWSRRLLWEDVVRPGGRWTRDANGKLVEKTPGANPGMMTVEDFVSPAEPKRLDQLALARDLDTEDVNFVFSDIARIWHMLEVENSFAPGTVDRGNVTFLREYKAKHNPVHLTAVDPGPVPKHQCNF